MSLFMIIKKIIHWEYIFIYDAKNMLELERHFSKLQPWNCIIKEIGQEKFDSNLKWKFLLYIELCDKSEFGKYKQWCNFIHRWYKQQSKLRSSMKWYNKFICIV